MWCLWPLWLCRLVRRKSDHKVESLLMEYFYILANSLTCSKCTSPSGCKSPSSETCSNSTANANKEFLEGYHSNVPTVNGSLSFSCANLTYYHAASMFFFFLIYAFERRHPNLFCIPFQTTLTPLSSWAASSTKRMSAIFP